MTYIIAEAGTTQYAVDPQWRIENAMVAIREAAQTGVDALKWQLFVPDEQLFCPLEGDDARWERWRYTYLSLDHWKFIKYHCEQAGMDFLASVFQEDGVNYIRELAPRYYKVASRAAMSFPYDVLPGPFLVSNGIGCPPMDKEAYILDCTMQYPAPMKAWNDINDGLSDHSGTVWPGLDAIFRGADFLEVHYEPRGLDAGPDAPVALHFDDLKLLCEARDAKRAMNGDILVNG